VLLQPRAGVRNDYCRERPRACGSVEFCALQNARAWQLDCALGLAGKCEIDLREALSREDQRERGKECDRWSVHEKTKSLWSLLQSLKDTALLRGKY